MTANCLSIRKSAGAHGNPLGPKRRGAAQALREPAACSNKEQSRDE